MGFVMLKRVVAVAAACTALSLSGRAAAEPPPQIAFRLDYQANLPGRGCPNADEFGLILAGEFGYLLVRDDAAATLRIETRTNGRRIEAELSAPNPTGDGDWRRVITSQDCRELLYDAATLIRIRFGPGGWQGEEPPPWLLAPPRFEVERPELRLEVPAAFLDSMAGEPSEAPLTPWEGTAPRWAQRAPVAEEQAPFQVEAALGPAIAPYGLPSVAVGGSGMLGVRWTRFAFAGEVRGVITPGSSVGDSKLMGRTTAWTGSLLPCLALPHVDGCGVLSVSQLQVETNPSFAVTGSDAFSVGFGARVNGRLRLSDRFTLVGYGDATMQLRSVAIALDPRTVGPETVPYWRSPLLRLTFGVTLNVDFLSERK
ncbi:MAG TPA: hypothetical protein VM694_32015 [Polyangium sp.]|nr:hypothetical protein [Polyangium sp.]